MSYLIEEWQQGNIFTITLRGHKLGIPEQEDTNVYRLYDSFFSPVDFGMGMLTVKVPECIPNGVKYRLEMRINGGLVEECSIPKYFDFNFKTYTPECTFSVKEDDFVEVEVFYEDTKGLLNFNDHNCHFAISGCICYEKYKDLFFEPITDIAVAAVIDKEVLITESLLGYKIENYTIQAGDLVIIRGQSNLFENGIYLIGADGNYVQSFSSSTRYLTLYNDSDSPYSGFWKGSITTIGGEDYISFDKELMSWEQGCFWWKTNIMLQNRSGLDVCQNSSLLDTIISPMDFMIQGVSIYIWDDNLIKRFYNKEICLYVDIFVNDISLFEYMNIQHPINLDVTSKKFIKADITFNTDDGFPVVRRNNLSIVSYFYNKNEKINGKKIQCFLSGCTPDCFYAGNNQVSVFEECEDDLCQFSLQTPRETEVDNRCLREKYKIAKISR